MMDLSIIKDLYKTAIVFNRHDKDLYSEFINEAFILYPERFGGKMNSFWSSGRLLKSNTGTGSGTRPAMALACDAHDYGSDTINWCDEGWYRDRGFTIIECSDLMADDSLYVCFSEADLSNLLFGGVR